MGLTITIEIPVKQFAKSADLAQKEIQTRLVAGVNAILDLIEATQIHKYTAAGEPDQPTGSTYVRTFTLRRSSRKEIKRRRLPIIQGLWSSDLNEAPYNKYVIGPLNEQAPIHRDRWKSIEEVVTEVEEKAPQIVEDKLNESRI